MRLYTGNSQSLIRDTTFNVIGEKLSDAFFKEYRHKPNKAEVQSWQNSLRAMAQTIQYAELKDLGIALEYQLPKATKRLDCLLTGNSNDSKPNVVIVELKQWQGCKESEGANEVRTWIAGALRDVQHPSAQVSRYKQYLRDGNTAFYKNDPLNLESCCYLHNYDFNSEDHLFSNKFSKWLNESPVFTKDDVPKLSEFLNKLLSKGDGESVLDKLDQGEEKPSKKLLDHISSLISGDPTFVLLDEQQVVFDLILAEARKSFKRNSKKAFIIKGGPGTGKSLVALNLLGELSRDGKDAYYATGSRAFTITLKTILGERAADRFKYFMNIGRMPQDSIDVMVADEAHRMRADNNNLYTKKEDRDPTPQVETLLKAAKVPVFFIDDRQLVRPDEKGSTDLIRENATKLGIEIQEFELEGQFRCGGSEGFVQWINNTLEIERSPVVMWDQANEVFDFKIFSSPDELDQAIRKKVEEGQKARMTAGFCWKWSKETEANGELALDVQINEFKRPWNAHPDAKKLKKSIPSANIWAHHPGGIDQIGCVYTAQGFEFDYVGVIFGKDLKYDFDNSTWIGDKKNSEDPSLRKSGDKFSDLVKNIYRVLLTRGMKGCYVYFQDKDTERFFKSRIEKIVSRPKKSNLKIIDDPKELKFIEYLPVFSLKAAAGAFSEAQEVEPEGWMQVEGIGKLTSELFVSKVVGHSMEPVIPDGSLCVFKKHLAGSRQGKIVLVQNNEICDPEHGGSYTVKYYNSEKQFDAEGNWSHAKITLKPRNKEFDNIELEIRDENRVKVLAEFVRVLE